MEKDEHRLLPYEKRQFEVIIKREEATSLDFGKHPDDYTAADLLKQGFVCLDKPPGPTSHQAADFVKRIVEAGKAGHSGTLDPKVTGVLAIGLNKSAKLNYLLLKSGKEYVGVMHLHSKVDDEKLAMAFKHFTGTIKQIPPIKSAVRRQLRERKVYYFDILERKDNAVLFRAGVEAGTYIRKLCHDVGQYLRVGAHMGDLRRTKAGSFSENESVILQDLREAYTLYKKDGNDEMLKKFLKHPKEAVKHIPKIYVLDKAVRSVCNGAYLAVPGIAKFDSDLKKGDDAIIMTLKDEVIGYGKSRMNADMLKNAKKGLVVDTDAIIMDNDTYPKIN